MSGYTIRATTDVPDIFAGRYPGAMRLMTEALDARQVALTHRLMPPRSGGKGSYGHRHKTQEEIYYVVSGTLQFKLEDNVIDVPAGSAVRVAPTVTRSIWNDGPDEAELVICSIRLEEPHADGELVEGFWSENGWPHISADERTAQFFKNLRSSAREGAHAGWAACRRRRSGRPAPGAPALRCRAPSYSSASPPSSARRHVPYSWCARRGRPVPRNGCVWSHRGCRDVLSQAPPRQVMPDCDCFAGLTAPCSLRFVSRRG